MVVVLALGNTLLSDEGVGPRILDALRDEVGHLDGEIHLVDGGTLGLALLARLDGEQDLLVLDAAETGGPPGTVIVRETDDLGGPGDPPLSPHQVGLADLLAAAELIGVRPRRVTLVGVQPGSVESGVGLSPEVSEAVPRAATSARLVIECWMEHGAASP